MSIENALASVAVTDIETAAHWYEQILGRPGKRPMPEVAEWDFPRGGSLQVYELPERAGNGSFTLAVDDIADVERTLAQMGVDASERSSNESVDTIMVTDPDGNHIAFAHAHDPTLAW
jgi:catechol 2,3-dioxygenase-like lactoylglutathione lyase family enzyme